jgi:hypothetical protein
VVDLGQSAQPSYLPKPVRHQLGAYPHEQGAHMVFTPGDRVELVATTDPYTHLQPGDRGTVTSVTDSPEPTINIQ